MTKIYLVTNCYGDPNKVYIGKTILTRIFKHRKEYGKCITYDYIDEVDSFEHHIWKPLESYWIEQFRQWGFEVVNKNKNGGGGPSFLTEKQRINMRKPHKICILRGPHSQEHKDKISKAMTGKPKTESWKQNLSHPKKYMPLKGPRSEETKLKIGKANSRPKPEGFGLLMSFPKPRPEMIGNSFRKGKCRTIIQFNKMDELIREWSNIQELRDYLIIPNSENNIYSCCRGQRKTAFGYKWKYK